jgi:osmoprotectant transport system substrate-binding protein
MRKTSLRTRSLALAATIVTLSLVLAACGSSDDSGDGGGSDDGGDKEALIVGSKDFAGAQVISQAYGQALEAEGYQITYKDNIGPTETVFPLLEKGDIDLYGEFSGTFLTYLGGTPTSDRTEVFTAVEDELADKDIVAVGPATAQDVNAFYVLEDTASTDRSAWARPSSSSTACSSRRSRSSTPAGRSRTRPSTTARSTSVCCSPAAA